MDKTSIPVTPEQVKRPAIAELDSPFDGDGIDYDNSPWAKTLDELLDRILTSPSIPPKRPAVNCPLCGGDGSMRVPLTGGECDYRPCFCKEID